jgi:hypothetical protein
MEFLIMGFGMEEDTEIVTSVIAVTDEGERVVLNLVSQDENVLDAVEEGTIIDTVDGTFVIANILDKVYNYVNADTGALRKNIKNVNDIEIAEINLDELTQTTAFVG